MLGLYIHVPFCVRKCDYCDFYSLSGAQDKIPTYIQAVLQEARKYAGMKFETIYLGGGTPSLLGAENLRLLSAGLRQIFDLTGVDEATLEVNPESATPDLLSAARECGFNRVSVGVQSLNDAELKSVGRIHSAAQAITAITSAQAAGFSNISTDLIIGLPGQTWRSLKKSLTGALAAGARHISAYCLSLENDTPLADQPPPNLPGDDRQAELFERARDFLQANRFIHYEISNFALPGSESRHNLNYWRGGEYLGLGPAAASHLEGIRFKNKTDLDAYLKFPTRQNIDVEQLDIKHKAEEEAILRLRLLAEGLDLSLLAQKYGQRFVAEIDQKLAAMQANGELIGQGSVFRLHPDYVLTSNRIFSRLITAMPTTRR